MFVCFQTGVVIGKSKMKKKAEEVLEPELQENDASIKNKKKVKAFFIL